ncbi:hypothetical protein GCM10009789_85710 [Kribbella sancticallisti]|uniref:HTH luxR-type domain-containing protein n=1 Tax=Kribbella sancticallisti TaxID=460087 RepID=A0ABN2EUW5_9ACTN
MRIEAVLPDLAVGDPQHVVEHDEVRARAAAAMHALRELIPWSGYALSAWDAGSGTHRHITLASEGYPAAVQDHMNDAFVEHNPGFRLLHTRVPRALRWSDLDRDWLVKFAQTYSAEVFLIPAGFKEGATMCLRLPDGRYTGALHVSWARARDASDGTRDIIEGFRPLLANACDLLSHARLGVHRMGPDVHAVLVSAQGTVSEMPGHLAGPLLRDGEHVRSLVARQGNSFGRRRYLWTGPEGTCHRIEIVPCHGEASLVIERQISWPFGLSGREAQILHWVAMGYSNPQIAARFYISSRTVSTHVEHILDKLACESRAQLAALAVNAELLLIEEIDAGAA